MAVTKEEIEEYLRGMTLLEAIETVKELEEVFGVTAAAAAAPMMSDSVVAAVATAEEKDSFDVILTVAGGNKIAVIKAVRKVVTSLGLKEAKELVDDMPKVIKEGISKDEAELIKSIFAEAGAEVEIKNSAYLVESSSPQIRKITNEEYERRIFENLDELKIINDRIQSNRAEINWLRSETDKTLHKINNLIEAM